MTDTIKFNDTDYSSTYGYKFQRIDFTPAERKVNLVDLPGCDGVYSQGDVFKETSFQVELAFSGDTTEEVYTHIGRFCAKLSEMGNMDIVISRHVNYKRIAYYLSCEPYTVIKGEDTCYADIILNFSMDKPYSYRTTGTKHKSSGATIHTLNVNNQGRRCPFTIKFTPSGTQSSVGENLKNILVKMDGVDSFWFYGSIDLGDYIIVDTDAYTIVDSAGDSQISRWEGDMPLLKHGLNTVTVTSKQGNIDVELVYTEIIF